MARKRPKRLSDQLRQIVVKCGKSRYQIGKETGIDESALSRFVHGERGLSMAAMDRLGMCLGLQIVTGSRTTKKKGR
ncbi:MAG: helix-turn-helix transcriptional regulator [Candidatus Nealsonbacteria bacterium]|nr:helix-turn-helix transcriptional regulator [Candidatus Nealsonbacteria bacterium]